MENCRGVTPSSIREDGLDSRLLVVVCITCIILFFCFFFSCGADARLTGLVLEGTGSYDFGTVHQGQLLRHQFVFVNQGSREVCAKMAKRSCTCTTAELSSTRVPCGQRCTLDVAVDTTWPPAGEVKNMVVVESWPSTDESQLMKQSLELKASVELAVLVTPTSLRLAGNRDEELTGFFLIQRQKRHRYEVVFTLVQRQTCQFDAE
jgi:hypothetical protein